MKQDNSNIIFLCYAREDKKQVDKIYLSLKKEGLNPWMDKPPEPYQLDGIQPGSRWETKIQSIIDRAAIFLAILSPTSVSKRGFVQKEYRLALEKMNEIPDGDIFLIPVLLEECEPPTLNINGESFKSISWYSIYEDGVRDLIEYIKNFISAKEQEKVHFGKRIAIDFGTSAIAIAYAAHEKEPEVIPLEKLETKYGGKRVLVYDIGAGTTDLTFMNIQANEGTDDEPGG